MPTGLFCASVCTLKVLHIVTGYIYHILLWRNWFSQHITQQVWQSVFCFWDVAMVLASSLTDTAMLAMVLGSSAIDTAMLAMMLVV